MSVYYITIDTKENAENLAKLLLEKKLIACANIVGSNGENPFISSM